MKTIKKYSLVQPNFIPMETYAEIVKITFSGSDIALWVLADQEDTITVRSFTVLQEGNTLSDDLATWYVGTAVNPCTAATILVFESTKIEQQHQEEEEKKNKEAKWLAEASCYVEQCTKQGQVCRGAYIICGHGPHYLNKHGKWSDVIVDDLNWWVSLVEAMLFLKQMQNRLLVR